MGRIKAPSVNGLDAPAAGAGVEGHSRIQNSVDHPGGFIGPHVVGALGPRAATRLEHHARAQAQQTLEVSAIQGQVVDVRVVECASQGGVGSLHQRDRLSDGDGLRLRARLNGQVSPNLLANAKLDVLALQLLESIGLGANRVRSRKQLGSVVLPGVIRGEGSCDTSVFVDDLLPWRLIQPRHFGL